MPATSNFGVNCPQACRFQGLLDQSEKTSAGLAAGAGIAKRLGEAGAILKSPAGAPFVGSTILFLGCLPAAFCFGQEGRAEKRPLSNFFTPLSLISPLTVYLKTRTH